MTNDEWLEAYAMWCSDKGFKPIEKPMEENYNYIITTDKAYNFDHLVKVIGNTPLCQGVYTYTIADATSEPQPKTLMEKLRENYRNN